MTDDAEFTDFGALPARPDVEVLEILPVEGGLRIVLFVAAPTT